ncbi:MAG TPA: hypothetical protein VGU27_01070 [Candidatus Eisenbacteria bacterium]|nr:hypothetical protein [Candidatus Eisenbacteria bacterium]
MGRGRGRLPALLLAVTLAAGASPAGADLRALAGVSALAAASRTPARAVTDPATGALQSLVGARIPLADGVARPGEAACAWALANAGAFGLRPGEDSLAVDEVRTDAEGVHVRLGQRWRGIPVEFGELRVTLNAAGEITFVAGTAIAGVQPAATLPAVGRAAAIATAATASGLRLSAGPATAECRVRRDGGVDRLAWRVTLAAARGPARLWVDAATGALLARDDGIAHAVGDIYPTDPRGPLATGVPLPPPNAAGQLRDAIVGIVDGAMASLAVPGGDLTFTPTDPDTTAFDQVNAWWHVHHFFQDVLAPLGYPGPADSVILEVRAPINPQVAFTSGRYVYLGAPIPNFTRDVAKSDDIAYHEMQHTVTYGFGIQPTGPTRESGAMHEALSDYFAAVTTNDPVIGEWVYLLFPGGATRVDEPASTFNYLKFDQVSYGAVTAASNWANGMILSGTLWSLRGLLAATADSLVLESLAYLPASPTWAMLADAMLQADLDRHAGVNQAAIVATFGVRHIHGLAVASIEGPTSARPDTQVTFAAAPCCGGQFGTYAWLVREWCHGQPCGPFLPAGSGTALALHLDTDTEVRLQVVSPWGDTLADSRFVSVLAPTVRILGPVSVRQGDVAAYHAWTTGAGRLQVLWSRTWRRFGATATPLGAGPDLGVRADTSFLLAVSVYDPLNRRADAQLDVRTFVDRPPPPGPDGLRLVAALPAGARQADVSLDLPGTAPTVLAVYDVRGRRRALLWDGPAGGGMVLRWDAGGLEPGVYFYRLDHAGAVLRQRFLVLR